MSRDRPHVLVSIVVAALAVGALRAARARPGATAACPPSTILRLPETLNDTPGVVERPTAADAILDGKRHVRIERRRYGDIQVALSTVRAGVREHHPPTVCLRASGYEVIRRRELRLDATCLTLLTLRRDGKTSAFAFTYLDQEGARTCSLWRRIVDASAKRLLGRDAPTWATLQVLAPNPSLAKRATLSILSAGEAR